MKPSIRVLTLALAFVMMLGLSGVSYAAAEADRSITVTENWTFDAGFYPVLSPSTSTNYGIAYWTRNFYQTLVTYDKAGQIAGELAESWTVSDDGLTYTFTLRDGVKFSDGSDLTSEDVKASFEGAIENLGAYNGSYGKLSAIIASMAGRRHIRHEAVTALLWSAERPHHVRPHGRRQQRGLCGRQRGRV